MSGKENVVADALSRVESISKYFDYNTLAESQNLDTELQQLLNSITSLRLEKVYFQKSNVWIYCDVSMDRHRPYVTPPLRKKVFNLLHGLSHPGAAATARLISERFVWPGVRRDCKQWSRECLHCQKCKISRHTISKPAAFSLPPQRFTNIHMDIIGPLPVSCDYKYCLTVVDRFTRWPEAYPLKDITAESCANAFIQGWVARFGCPQCIVTDRGKQFDSQLFRNIAALVGAQHLLTTAYHPACNGLVERCHRQLKAAIMCHDSSTWSEALPLVLLGMRSAWKEDLQASSADLVYGEPLRLPGEFLCPIPGDLSRQGLSSFTSRLRSRIVKLSPQPTTCIQIRFFIYRKIYHYPLTYFYAKAQLRNLYNRRIQGPIKSWNVVKKPSKLKFKAKI